MGVSMCRSHPPACYPCSVLAVWWHRSTTDSRQIHRWTSSSSFSGSSSSPSSSVRSLSFSLLLLLARPHTCFSLSPTTRGHTHRRARNILPHRFPFSLPSLFSFSLFSFSLSSFSPFISLPNSQSIPLPCRLQTQIQLPWKVQDTRSLIPSLHSTLSSLFSSKNRLEDGLCSLFCQWFEKTSIL